MAVALDQRRKEGTASPELDPPILIEAGGTPIDVEVGHAAPALADVDGSGNPKLLVGQFKKGRLRVYTNVGSRARPRFDENFEWLRAGRKLGKVPPGCCVGFTPQFVDFDHDGMEDLLSGSWPGELYFFKGKGKGRFAEPVTVTYQNGEPVKIDDGSTVFATDWRGTGRPDLLVGTVRGFVYLVPDTAKEGPAAFGKPIRLRAGGNEIKAPGGKSHPIAADWDNTGLPGLLLGCEGGGVQWYRNIGTRRNPELDQPVTLVENSPPSSEAATAQGPARGYRSKIAVYDWNNDGLLDLVVGDTSSRWGRDLKLTKEQVRLRDETLAELQARAAILSKRFHSVEKLRDPRKRKAAEARLAGELLTPEKMARQAELHRILAPLQRSRTTHGHVWVYLRNAQSRSGHGPARGA